MRRFMITLTLLAAFGSIMASGAQAGRISHSHFGRMAFVNHNSTTTMHHH